MIEEQVLNWKPSRFNYQMELEDGRRIVYNTASAAMVVVASAADEDALLRGIVRSSKLSDEEWELIRNGFLVEEGFDEIAALRGQYENERYSGYGAAVSIAPTLGCNL